MMRSTETRKKRNRLAVLGLLLLLMPLVGAGFARLFFSNAGQQESPLSVGHPGEESAGVTRKNIYDRQFRTLAVSFPLAAIYARPLEVDDPESTARVLAEILEADEDALAASLKTERSFAWIARQVTREKAKQIEERHLDGIRVVHLSQRYYPYAESGAHLVGFVKDDQGLAGLEAFYDNILRGGGVYDLNLAQAGLPEDIVSGLRGAHLVTSIDITLQQQVEKELDRLMARTKASGAMAMFMARDSGEILAMVSRPAYDPNRFWDFTAQERRNLLTTEPLPLGPLAAIFVVPRGETFSPGGVKEREKGKASWVGLPDGSFASPQLAALAGREGAFLVNEKDVHKLGVCGAGVGELPTTGVGFGGALGPAVGMSEAANGNSETGECEGVWIKNGAVAMTGIKLLAGFTAWLGGYGSVQPRLVKGVWDGTRFWPFPVPGHIQGPIAGGIGSSSVAGAQDPVVFSSLVPGDAPGRKFHLLSVGTGGSAEVVMLLALVEAAVDPAQAPPAGAVFSRSLQMASRVLQRDFKVADTQWLAQEEEKYYQGWLAHHQATKLQTFASPDAVQAAMPSVLGFSLRRALQVLQEHGLKLKVVGSGTVVAQHPPPGMPLDGVSEGVIELSYLATER